MVVSYLKLAGLSSIWNPMTTTFHRRILQLHGLKTSLYVLMLGILT